MNAVTIIDKWGTSVTVEAGPEVVEIADWEPIFVGILVTLGYHPKTAMSLFASYEDED